MALLVLADVDQRVLLGELGESSPERALLLRPAREDHRLERRAREARRRPVARRRLADRVADPDGAEPRIIAISPAMRTSRRGAPAGAKTRIELAFASPSTADAHALARTERPREQPGVGDALARRGPFDLEHPTRDRCARSRRARPQEARRRRRAARRCRCRAQPSRRTPGGRPPGASGRPAPLAAVGSDSGSFIPDEGAEDGLVALGEDLDQRGPVDLVVLRE